MTQTHIAYTHRSSNAKVGKIPVTTSSKTTCPSSCPLLDNGCYASAGFHTNMHWNKVTSGERGTPIAGLCASIAKLPEGQLWRHNVAGDLIGTEDNVIDQQALYDLTVANKGRRGFTYTHYPMSHSGNQSIVRKANQEGFTINVSTNTVLEAIATHEATGLPTVTIVAPEFWAEGDRVGNVVRCPAETRDTVTCKTCKLCSVSTRRDIVAFTVHGTKAKAANLIAIG
jgi:hypothetical protein